MRIKNELTNNTTQNTTNLNNQSNTLTMPKWYILHTFSSYENMAKVGLTNLIQNCGLQDQIIEVKIPTETTVKEYANGKKKLVERKLTPNYIYVKMIYSNQLAYLITTVRGITGFVGPMGKAIPMTETEVRKMHLEERIEGADFAVGDKITVVNGPLSGFEGIIRECNNSTQKAKVVISMFGKEQEVEIEYVQMIKSKGGI